MLVSHQACTLLVICHEAYDGNTPALPSEARGVSVAGRQLVQYANKGKGNEPQVRQQAIWKDQASP